MQGGDYRDFTYAEDAPANIANCSATCAAEAVCLAWTYVREGQPDDDDPNGQAVRLLVDSSANASGVSCGYDVWKQHGVRQRVKGLYS